MKRYLLLMLLLSLLGILTHAQSQQTTVTTSVTISLTGLPANCTLTSVSTIGAIITGTITCSNNPPPVVTSVTVSCVPTSVQTGGQSVCTATVKGTGNFSPAVTWSTTGGNITSSGVLTAPSTPVPVAVTAISTQTPSVKGSANVTVTSATTPIAPGDTVVVISGGIDQAKCQGGPPSVVPAGATGTVVAGPSTMLGIKCWNVAFNPPNTGFNGWTPDSGLAVGTPTPPPPVTSSCSVIINPTGGIDNSNWISKINAAIAQKTCAEVVAGTYTLQPFTPPASTPLFIDDGVTINDTAGCAGYGRTDVMFLISNSNVHIQGTGPKFNSMIQMINCWNNAHKQVAAGQDYEYQHAISFRGGNNSSVSGLNIQQSGGDGVNFTSGSGLSVSNVVSNNNIRQGYSVTNGVSATINGGSANNGPLSGLDIEPDNTVQNITMVINNFTTSGNKGGGTSFGLMNIGGASTVNIIATNLKSVNDNGTGIAFWNSSNGPGNDATGSVICNNCSVTGSGFDGTYGRRSYGNWVMTFNNLTITNPNRNGTDPHYGTDAALGVAVTGGQLSTIPGGVVWNNVTITGAPANCTDIGSNAQGVSVSGTCNGKPL